MPDPIAYNPNQLPTVINTVVALSTSVRNIDLSFQALKTTFINAADLNSLSTKVTDLNTTVLSTNLRLNAALKSLPSRQDYAALTNKVTAFSTTLISTISTSINTDPLNALITAKLESSGTYTDAITTYLNTYGDIALKPDLSAAVQQFNTSISTLSTAVASRYATSAMTLTLQSQITELSQNRVRVLAFNALSSYIYSTITNSAELSNPAAITEEINRRLLNTTYIADLSNTTAAISNISTNYAKISDLSALSTFITNTFSTATITFSTISGLSANIGSTIVTNFSTLSGSISSNVYTLNTSISTLSTAAAVTYATLSGVSIIRQDLSSLSSYVNTLSGNIYSILGGNISGTLSTNISTLYSQISTANAGNLSTFSTVFGDISQISSVQRDLSAHFLKYYTSSIVDGISGDLHILYDNLQSDVEIIGSQIPIQQEDISAADIEQIGSQNELSWTGYDPLNTITVPSDAQWMYIVMKGGNGISGDNTTSIRPFAVAGYIPVMPYDIIKFYPGNDASNSLIGGLYPTAQSKLAGTIYDSSTNYYGSNFNGVPRFFNGDTSYNATGAASGLAINGTLVIVAKGGRDINNIQPAGGEAGSYGRNPYNYPIDASQKYYKQLVNLDLFYNINSGSYSQQGQILYTFYKYTNPPQFSFKYAVDTSGNNGINTTYVDEFANYIVGTDKAPRRLLVNGLVDICGAIRNGSFYSDSFGKTVINTSQATPLKLMTVSGDASGTLHVDSSNIIHVSSADIRLNTGSSTVSIADIPNIYATRADLSNTSVSLGGVTGAFTVVSETSTIKAYDGTGTYQGFIRVGDNGKIILNDTSATFNVPVWTTSGLNVVGNISGSAGLTIGGTSRFNNTVTVSGDISGLAALNIGGRTRLGNTLTVSGDISGLGGLNIGGAAVIRNSLTVSGGNITCNGDMNINGSVYPTNSQKELNVYGNIFQHMTSDGNTGNEFRLGIDDGGNMGFGESGASRALVKQYPTIYDPPAYPAKLIINRENDFGSGVFIESKLDVSDAVKLNKTLTVTGDISGLSRLTVSGQTVLNNGLQVTGDISTNGVFNVKSSDITFQLPGLDNPGELVIRSGNDTSSKYLFISPRYSEDNVNIGAYNLQNNRASDLCLQVNILNQDNFNSGANKGNVGIGIATPTARLDINGSLRARGNISGDGNLSISGSTTLNGSASIQGPLKVGNDGSAASSNILYFAGTNEDLINTISGNIKATTAISERIYDTAEKSELLLFKGNDSSSTSAGPDRIRLVSTGGMIFQTSSDSIRYDISTGKISKSGENTYYDSDTSFNTALHINDAGKVFIGSKDTGNSSNILNVNGNVGISGNVNISGRNLKMDFGNNNNFNILTDASFNKDIYVSYTPPSGGGDLYLGTNGGANLILQGGGNIYVNGSTRVTNNLAFDRRLFCASGTAQAPSITYEISGGETYSKTGMYFQEDQSIGFSCSGQNVMTISQNNVTIAGSLISRVAVLLNPGTPQIGYYNIYTGTTSSLTLPSTTAIGDIIVIKNAQSSQTITVTSSSTQIFTGRVTTFIYYSSTWNVL